MDFALIALFGASSKRKLAICGIRSGSDGGNASLIVAVVAALTEHRVGLFYLGERYVRGRMERCLGMSRRGCPARLRIAGLLRGLGGGGL